MLKKRKDAQSNQPSGSYGNALQGGGRERFKMATFGTPRLTLFKDEPPKSGIVSQLKKNVEGKAEVEHKIRSFSLGQSVRLLYSNKEKYISLVLDDLGRRSAGKWRLFEQS